MQQQLTWSLISNDPQDAVTDVNLFDSTAAGIKIKWESSNETVIGNDGSFTRPEVDTPVILTARLYKEEDSSQYVEKKFDITVPAKDQGNLAYGKTVKTDMSVKSGSLANVTDGSVNTFFSGTAKRKTGTLTVDLGKTMPISSVKLFEGNDAILGFTIDTSTDNTIWNTAYTGTTIGENLNAEIEPVLARYVRLNVNSVQSGLPITISEMEVRFDVTDQQCVNADAKVLTTGALYEVSSDLTLTYEGAFGSEIVWESSRPDLISNSGKYLKRPASDTIVVMKATLKKGNAAVNKTFNHLITGSRGGSISGSSGGSSGGGGSIGGSSVYSPHVTGVTEPVVSDNPAAAKVFVDIDSVPWAVEAITALKNKEVVSGDGFGNYEPSRAVTREEFVKMLLLTLSADIDAAEAENPFTDCTEDEWYWPYVIAAYESGIVQGMPDGTFGVGIPITRQDMAVMVYRAAVQYGITLSEGESKAFSDAEAVGEYATEAIDKLSAAGVFSGDDSDRFNPIDNANRAEVAVVMYRLSK